MKTMPTRYKNRPPGSRPQSLSLLLAPREMAALKMLAKIQEVPIVEALRRALKSYARSALSFDEYRSFYPPEGDG